MNWFDVFTAVVLANLLCGWAAYGLWWGHRQPTAIRPMLIVIGCGLTMVLAVIAARY